MASGLVRLVDFSTSARFVFGICAERHGFKLLAREELDSMI